MPIVRIRTTAAALMVGLFAGLSTAVADEMLDKPTWQGFYIGLGGGYFNADNKLSHPTFPSFSSSPDGGLLGIYTGYNYQLEKLVFGIELDAYLGFGGKTRLAGLPVPSVMKNKVGANWSARARLGWDAGLFMPYLTAGYVGATNKQTFTTGYIGSDSKTLQGWTIGGGADYGLTPNWLLRLDYQYQDFGKRSFFKSTFPPSGYSQKVQRNQITLGLSYKF